VIRHLLALFLFILAAFFSLGAAWFGCALTAASQGSRVRAMFGFLLTLALVIIAVLAAAGAELLP
jgi:hypothetical protein